MIPMQAGSSKNIEKDLEVIRKMGINPSITCTSLMLRT